MSINLPGIGNPTDIRGSWGTWLLHLFSCRGSYLGSPCLSSLSWASPTYLRGFLFSCRPFCLWFWSFHNVGCFQWITPISNRSPQCVSNSHNFLHLPPLLYFIIFSLTPLFGLPILWTAYLLHLTWSSHIWPFMAIWPIRVFFECALRVHCVVWWGICICPL